MRSRLAIATVLAASALSAGAGAEAQAQTDAPYPVGCAGPAPDVEPDTGEWFEREQNNIYCARQRHDDQALHPVTPLPATGPMFGTAPISLTDAYREPTRHDDGRFRFEELTITNRSGEALDAEVYRPCAAGTCALPGAPQAFEPPYPAVVVLHGGGSRKELHWWSSQTLAEAGYMVVTFNGAAGNMENASDVLDWLFATPAQPTAAGEHNPH